MLATTGALARGRLADVLLAVIAVVAIVPVVRAATEDTEPELAPRIPALIDRAAAVVIGSVGAMTEHDDGRLVRAQVRVDKVVKGAAGTTGIDVVEDRRFPSSVPTLHTGKHVALFLERARPTSQLRRALPAGTYYRLAGDRWGLIEIPDAAAERAVIAALEGWRALPHAQDRSAALRRLVFSEIGSGPPRLVEDGTAALRQLPGLSGKLTADEKAALVGALVRTDLPQRVRIGLVDAIADADLRTMVSALRNLPGATPDLVRASAAARGRLGSGPKRAEIDTVLREGDAAMRAASMPALLRAEDGGVAAVADLAVTDPAVEVRVAAIRALGESASSDALPTLARTFVDPDPDVRLESARAIHTIGGSAAARTLTDLVFEAPTADQQRQATMLLLTLVPSDDPLVLRIRDQHPDADIRDLVVNGVKFHAHH